MVRAPLAIVAAIGAAAIASIVFHALSAAPAAANAETNRIPPVAAIDAAPPKNMRADANVATHAWTALSPEQRDALAPLAGEWEKLDAANRKLWLRIASRFPSMTAAQRQRVQSRMEKWAKLSPQQRRSARQAYARAKALVREQKSARWQDYQQLSENEKLRLGSDHAGKNRIATLPPRQAGGSIVPPIQAADERMMADALKPQAANTGFEEAADRLF